MYSYFDFSLKTALESCSTAQIDSASLVDRNRKKIFGWGCGIFVTDVISEVVLGLFWLMLPGLGPNR